jgi:hypothetical protein
MVFTEPSASTWLDLSIVAFADALGTSKQSRSDKADEFLAKLLAGGASVRGRVQFLRDTQIGVRWFSDSLLISCPAHDMDVSTMLDEVAVFQGAFAAQGIFLRGAIALGKHHHGENIDFGPALTNAVWGEKHVAGDTTSIVILDTLAVAVEQALSAGNPKPKVCRDKEDRRYFLDFIDVLEPPERQMLRTQIETQIGELGGEPGLKDSDVGRKFAWLVAYYNWRTGTANPIAGASAHNFVLP